MHALGAVALNAVQCCPQIIFPVTALKDLKILVKFNSFGFVFVWFCVVFIVFKGAQAFMRHDVLTADHPPTPPVPGEHPSTTVDLVASIAFGTMSGMASLAFFIHNVIHTIAKNSDPLVIKRDVVLGFTLAGGVYTLVGVMGAFGLAESSVHATQLDNILVVYSDTYVVAARVVCPAVARWCPVLTLACGVVAGIGSLLPHRLPRCCSC